MTEKSQIVSIRVQAKADRPLDISTAGLFLYDLDSLYKIIRLALDPAYKSYRFSRFSLYRNGRPLADQDRLLVKRLKLSSPLEVLATVAAVGGAATTVAAAVWTLVQTIEKIYNLRLNREKLELEVFKLQREAVQPRLPLDLPDKPLSSDRILKRRAADEPLETLEKRLASSAIQITNVEIEVLEQTSSPRRS
jgi:hypothetical protein